MHCTVSTRNSSSRAQQGRVHLDPLGNVFVCQGISIGNAWKTTLAEIMSSYRPAEHPVVGPLLAGGPVELGRAFGVELDDGYVDHCHMCFALRKELLERCPDALCPKSVYGLDD